MAIEWQRLERSISFAIHDEAIVALLWWAEDGFVGRTPDGEPIVRSAGWFLMFTDVPGETEQVHGFPVLEDTLSADERAAAIDDAMALATQLVAQHVEEK